MKTTYEEEHLEETKKIINQNNILTNKDKPLDPTKQSNLMKKLAKFEKEKNLGESWGSMEKQVIE